MHYAGNVGWFPRLLSLSKTLYHTSSVDGDVNGGPVGRNWLRKWFQTLNLSFTYFNIVHIWWYNVRPGTFPATGALISGIVQGSYLARTWSSESTQAKLAIDALHYRPGSPLGWKDGCCSETRVWKIEANSTLSTFKSECVLTLRGGGGNYWLLETYFLFPCHR